MFLPTSGAARLRGGLSAADFVKIISVQELTPAGLDKLTPAIGAFGPGRGVGSARTIRGGASSAEVRR